MVYIVRYPIMKTLKMFFSGYSYYNPDFMSVILLPEIIDLKSSNKKIISHTVNAVMQIWYMHIPVSNIWSENNDG